MGDAAAPRRSGGGGGGGWQPRGRGRGYFRSNGSGGRFNGNQAAKGASASGSLPLLDSQGSQQVITDMLEVSQGPYSGWRLYHKQETEQRKRRSPNWGEAETQLLLRLWAERVQEMKTTKRNGFMLEEMAQMLQASGFSRSSTEVKTRIANLSQEYRMELRKRTLGFPHGNFKLWDAVHLILGSEENASANLSASFTSAEQQHFLNESWQAEQQATSQQGNGEGAESLCCDIDPGMLMGPQDTGDEEEGEENEEEEEGEEAPPQHRQQQQPPPPMMEGNEFSGLQMSLVEHCKFDEGHPKSGKFITCTGFREGSATVSKVRAAEAFITSHSQLWRLQEVEEHRAFPIDLRMLKEDEDFLAAWPHFLLELSDSPELTLACLGLAMHQTIVRELNSECARHLPPGETPPPIELPVVRARILGHEPIIQLKHLKANFYSKLVTVRGTIIRVGGLKLLCTWLAFSCNSCGSIQAVRQPEGQFSPPSRCVTGGCRAKTFTPLHSNHLTQTTNWQTLKLQEIVDDDQREGGRVPRTLEVELTEDLVESCTPGDEVTVTGVVKVLNSDEASKKRTAGGPSMFQLYLDAVSLTSSKNNTGGLASTGDIKFNMQDYYAIQEIHSEPELFRLLVASLCPTIYGHEMVKAGLLLALFGGSPRPAQGSGRSDAHVLVVGDPGLGKSQMLQAVTSVAPRGVYVCGNTSSAAGLTVTLTRESGGDFALEAGALVLADQGCCCIDEFDKMSNQHQALLEAMEQQSVSVAKAGVVCSLPARASVLAAANPVGGHYNRAKTVAENLRLGPALLSRFDLVFILLDQPNEQMDSLLSDHIMALHSGGRKGAPKQQQRGHSDSLLSSFTTDQPLSERLKVSAGENLDTIPTQLLRKYVAYARKYVRPKLSEAAAQVLQQFYLRLRAQRGNQDCTPVTTRQLESLIRLTEARAKLELREQATEDDAKDVVELMKHSLLDTFCDELGSLDFQRSQNGSGTSSRSQAKKFVSLLQRRAELQTKSIFSAAELREVASQGRINIPDFSNFLATLNHQGFLLKKGTNLYQLLSADY